MTFFERTIPQLKAWFIAKAKKIALDGLWLAGLIVWIWLTVKAIQWGMTKPPILQGWDQWFILAMMLQLGIGGYFGRRMLGDRSSLNTHHVRGALTTDAKAAKREAEAQAKPGEPTFLFGDAKIPFRFAAEHLLIAGSSGSGKTTLVRRLMRSVIGPHQIREVSRSLVLDGAGDLKDTVYALAGDAAVVNMDPFDLRSAAWDIAKDAKTLAQITAVTSILFPRDEKSNSPFFSEAVQSIAVAVMEALNQNEGHTWTFSDFIRILDDIELLQKLLAKSPGGRATLSKYFRSGTTLDNIVATLDTKVRDYRTVAALWDHTDKKYSVEDWLHGHDVLYLRHTQEAPEAVQPINRALIYRAIQALLSGPDRKPESWFFLDEFASLGKIDPLPDLLALGRKKGACVLLTLQNFSVVKRAYDEDEAKAMLGLCTTKALLRFEGDDTAAWAADCFGGKRQVLQVFRDPSTTPTADGYAYRHASAEEMLVMPSEFTVLPKLSSGTLAGYFVVPGKSGSLRFKDEIPARSFFPLDGAPAEPSGKKFARPPEHQFPKTRLEPPAEASADESRGFAEDLKKFRNQEPEP